MQIVVPLKLSPYLCLRHDEILGKNLSVFVNMKSNKHLIDWTVSHCDCVVLSLTDH